jgi:hypothetical protein
VQVKRAGELQSCFIKALVSRSNADFQQKTSDTSQAASNTQAWPNYSAGRYAAGRMGATPRTQTMAAPKKDKEEDEDDVLFMHSMYKPSELTPRVRASLRQFPCYTGDLPPEEAEEMWTEQELHGFFFSNGFIRPWRLAYPS